MVVLHHDELHRTLWGAASTAGRSAKLDAAVYMQLVRPYMSPTRSHLCISLRNWTSSRSR